MRRFFFFLFIAFALTACTGNKQKQQTTDNEAGKIEAEVLKGEIIPIDTALFRYAYRIRLQGDKVVVLDLHNTNYYYHAFSYPEFKYLSSFGKRGEGPEEMVNADNFRFIGYNKLYALDSNKRKLYCFSEIGTTPKLENSILFDEKLLMPLDFDIYQGDTIVIPDYSGEKRFCWANTAGKLLYKSEMIPTVQKELLKESAPAVSQGWRSFVMFSPDKQILASVTQLGEVFDIYNLQTGKHIHKVGKDGEPQFKVNGEGYGFPTGGMGYWDIQVGDKYIYTIYDGKTFKEIMAEGGNGKQGGYLLRIFDFDGNIIQEYAFDRPIAGLTVNEMDNTILATDVNADEQIVKYKLPFLRNS